MMRLRWKLKPRKTGLMAIGAGPRGSVLHDGKSTFAYVIAHIPEHTGRTEWLWVAGWDSDVPYYNSCNDSGLTEAEAKAAAMAYVKKHLARQEGKSHDN